MKKIKIKLFGRKKEKKYSIKNSFKSKFIESVKFNEHRDHESEIIDNRFDGVPFLPSRKFNYSIPNELLSQLPSHLQRCWNKIDLKEYFREPIEELIPPTPPEPPIEPTPNLFQLIKDKEKRIKLKSIILGELNEKSEGWYFEENKSSINFVSQQNQKDWDFKLNYVNYLRFKNLASELKLSFKEYRYALKLFNQTVRKEQGNCCAVCDSTYKVTIHHLFFKGFFPKLSLNPNNGIPLCLICHSQVHGKMLMVSEDKKIKIKAMVLSELDDN